LISNDQKSHSDIGPSILHPAILTALTRYNKLFYASRKKLVAEMMNNAINSDYVNINGHAELNHDSTLFRGTIKRNVLLLWSRLGECE
jgi:hypothetical protein